jgi:hypothetical protein
MKSHSWGFEILVGGLLIVGVAGILGVPWLREWRHGRERRIIYEEVVRKLRVPHCNEEGFWVGDITELYRLGQISREVAEADTAPLNRLVTTPVPFHGYYVRAMVSGPSMNASGDTPESFQGRKRVQGNFALCIYPGEPGPRKYAWIMNRLSELRREDGMPPPGFAFPTLKERQSFWAIVD